MWGIPSGGIGYAIAWFVNRRTRNAEDDKKVQDIYKQMYDTVSAELLKLQRQFLESNAKIEELTQENIKTHRLLNRISRAIEAIERCPYSPGCPVLPELQASEEIGKVGNTGGKGVGQQRSKGGSRQKAANTSYIRDKPELTD